MAIGAANIWTLHTVSGTHNGVKKTTKSYGALVEAYCAFGASSESNQVGDVIVPINRHMAVTFLNAEKGRLRRDRRSRRGEAPTPPAPADAASLAVTGHAAAHEQVGGRGHADVGQRGASKHDGGEHESDTLVVGSSSGSDDDDSRSPPSASPAMARRVSRLQAEPTALLSAARSGGCGAAGPAPTGSRPGRATAHPGVSAEDGSVSEPAAVSSAATGPSLSPQTATAAAAGASMVVPPLPRKVGQSVLRMHQSSFAKVGSIFNNLWTGCKCAKCAEYDVEAYESVGNYDAANLVVQQSKRQRFLEDNAAGVSKAKGGRDPTLPDVERRTMTEGLLLYAVTGEELKKHMLLSSLLLETFSLEARGATAHGLEWSDLSVRRFPSMFGAGGAQIQVLCTYVSATKTQEGGAYCLGAIGQVDPWLCPLGAAADALVAACHHPGWDSCNPPMPLRPNFEPTDEELRAAGVDLTFYWEAGCHLGFRQWYCWRLFPVVRGGLFKEMPYAYHLCQLKEAWRDGGLPGEAGSTYAFRRAAAQRGKEAGVSLSDNLLHGMWKKGTANGVYDGIILNVPMMAALSGRAPDCQSLVTPRLTVAVPVALQRTLCSWLEREEESCAARVVANANCYEKALLDFFGIVRSARFVCFQTRAARTATSSMQSVPFSATLCWIRTNSALSSRRWRSLWPTPAWPWRRRSLRFCQPCPVPSRFPWRQSRW